jgi:hypothetical protein
MPRAITLALHGFESRRGPFCRWIVSGARIGLGRSGETRVLLAVWYDVPMDLSANVAIQMERLELRPQALDDAQTIFDSFASDPRVTHYMDWVPLQDADP